MTHHTKDQGMAEREMPPLLTKELAVRCICAWNNVPFDNAAMIKYTDEKWSPNSFFGWERVAKAIYDYIQDDLVKERLNDKQ